MTFKEWIEQEQKKGAFGDTPEGDFAADVLTDKKFRDFKTWKDLEMYLAFHGACREALKAAKAVWKQWKLSAQGRDVEMKAAT